MDGQMGMMKSCCLGMGIFGWIVIIAFITQIVLLAILLVKVNRLGKR
jgi:hypothetical protein